MGQQIQESKIAVLVDCDNTSPTVLEHALKIVAQFGRVVVRRGYGNHATLTSKWQEALVRLAFTPILQFQFAKGKNTADIALALDALEALFDHKADTFCIVTSDSDFAHLCRKLRERGATVYIVGEEKTPDALRNASDQFFEHQSEKEEVAANTVTEELKTLFALKDEQEKAETSKPIPKQRPKFLVEAVKLLAAETAEGKVRLDALGQYLKRTDPAFTPQKYGHSGLLVMVGTYDLLTVKKEAGGQWVRLNLQK